MTLAEEADQGDLVLPEGVVIQDEISLRQERLENLAKARAVLEARAQARYEAEQAEYEAKVKRREEQARRKQRKPGGRPPKAPEPGPRDKDQYNFTDPDSRIMKNSTNDGRLTTIRITHQRQLEMPTEKAWETATLFWRRRADDRNRCPSEATDERTKQRQDPATSGGQGQPAQPQDRPKI